MNLFLVVTITWVRLIVVVKPLYSQVYRSNRHERKALIIILLVSILSITPYYHYHSNLNAKEVLKVVSAMLSLLCPWVICVFLWVSLIRIVGRDIGTRKLKSTLHSEVISQRLKSKFKITRMILVICLFNIICRSPTLILTIFGLIDDNPCGYIYALIFVCFLFISNLLLIVNHSINFFIYSLTNDKFRYILQIMYRRCCFCHDYSHSQRSAQQQHLSLNCHRKVPISR